MVQEQKRLLLSLAHPDDESFGMAGTVARYTGAGVAVYLICATDGDAGFADTEFMEGYQSVGRLRLDELRCAAETLGIEDVITFGYRDSGMKGTSDNLHPDSLCAAPLDDVIRRTTETIRRVRPQVVVTFDPYGGYGHPDHVIMNRATSRAFKAASDSSVFVDQIENGLSPYSPQKLYYMTFDRRVMRIVVRLMPLFGQDPSRMGRNKDIDYREIARNSYPIHARIATRDYAELADRARGCHASQLGGLTGQFSLWQRIMRLLFSRKVDTFMRAYPLVEGRVRERDLFQGVIVD